MEEMDLMKQTHIIKEFTCSCCKEKFPLVRADEETLKEKEELFPDVDMSEMVLICEECYIEVMKYNEDHRYKKYLK